MGFSNQFFFIHPLKFWILHAITEPVGHYSLVVVVERPVFSGREPVPTFTNDTFLARVSRPVVTDLMMAVPAPRSLRSVAIPSAVQVPSNSPIVIPIVSHTVEGSSSM